MKSHQRIWYFDVLRCAATLAVIILHVSAENWYGQDVHSTAWQAFNMWDSLVRWSVPIFVMISGALFLSSDRDITIQNLFKKNILRIITAFIFWSIVYAVYQKIINPDLSLAAVCTEIISGHYHMWFLFMIVGLYLIVPLLRPVMCNDNLVKYFLILAFLFNFGFSTIQNLAKYFIAEGSSASTLWSIIDGNWKNMNFHFTLGYVGYFVAGYYINKKDIPPKQRKLIYFLSVLGFFSTIFISLFLAYKYNEPVGFYNYLSLNIFFEAIGVFIFCKYHAANHSERVTEFIFNISKNSFGIYLVHPLLIEIFSKCGIQTMKFEPYISVPVISCVVFAAAYILSAVIHHIPILKKYVV